MRTSLRVRDVLDFCEFGRAAQRWRNGVPVRASRRIIANNREVPVGRTLTDTAAPCGRPEGAPVAAQRPHG